MYTHLAGDFFIISSRLALTHANRRLPTFSSGIIVTNAEMHITKELIADHFSHPENSPGFVAL